MAPPTMKTFPQVHQLTVGPHCYVPLEGQSQQQLPLPKRTHREHIPMNHSLGEQQRLSCGPGRIASPAVEAAAAMVTVPRGHTAFSGARGKFSLLGEKGTAARSRGHPRNSVLRKVAVLLLLDGVLQATVPRWQLLWARIARRVRVSVAPYAGA